MPMVWRKAAGGTASSRSLHRTVVEARPSGAVVQDLRSLADGEQITTDICIVGSGPAGVTIAAELAGTGARVLIVESGDVEERAEVDRLSQIESVGAARVMEPTKVRNRVFGGTSHSWAGRCATFDQTDFLARPWVPFSGWPFDRREVEPYLDRATSHLGLAPLTTFERVRHDPSEDGPIEPSVDTAVWQYSRHTQWSRDYRRFGPAFLARPCRDARVLLNATTTEILSSETGSEVTGVVVRTLDGRHATVQARVVVLCAGGIENARLLLMSRRASPAGLGNRHGTVGRFLMDHPRCVLGEFRIDDFRALRSRFGLFRPRGGRNVFVRGIALRPAFQEREHLLNGAAWLTEERAEDDPWDAAKRLMTRRSQSPASDAWAVLSKAGWLLHGLDDRVRHRRGLPHKLRRLVLDATVEQRPDPDSRLTLGDRLDPLGLPVARLDWRIGEQEKRTMAALGRETLAFLARANLPPMTLSDWVVEQDWSAARFVDVAHPTGTTRMGDDEKTSVVDRHSKVHRVANLFVAGSSTFPTSGHANPTWMIVAMSVRLADHLKHTVLS